MKKILLISLAFILLSFSPTECSFYFMLNMGDQIEMQSFDAKNKLTGTSKQTVTAKKDNKLSFKSVTYDHKQKEKGSVLYDVLCENGNVKVDMKAFLNPEVLNSYDPATIVMDGNNLEIPSNLVVGQALPNGFITLKTTGDMGMLVMEVNVSNRKVAAKEDVTCDAGTFNCFKITSDIDSKVAFIKSSGTAIDWYSPEKGLIRSENYNKKGVLTGYNVRSK